MRLTSLAALTVAVLPVALASGPPAPARAQGAGPASSAIGRPRPDSLRVPEDGDGDGGAGRGGLRVLWRHDLGRGTTLPAGGDTLYTGTPDRRVIAFDPRTGAVHWRVSLDGPVDVTPALRNGRVAAHAGGRKPAVHLLDARSGAERWKRRTGGTAGGAGLEAAGGGDALVLAASMGGVVEALDVSEGESRWKARTRTPALARPLAIDSVLFVPTLTDSLARFDLASGRRLASVHAGAAQPAGLLRSGDRAFLLTSEGDLLGVDASGSVLFRTSIGGPATACPALSGDTLYAATAAGDVVAASAHDGAIFWRRSFAETYAAAPAPAFGLLWIGALSGEVHGLDPSTGEERARFREDGAIRWLLPAARGVLLLGLEGGKVAALGPARAPGAEAPPG